MNELVLLWVAASTTRFEVAESRPPGIRVVRCPMRDVPSYTVGGSNVVIAVVDDDRESTEALGAGVDEVIRHGDLTHAELDRASERAVARARTRLRAFEVAQPTDDTDALTTLLDWVAIELVACVSGAVLEGDLLEENVRKMLELREKGVPRREDDLSAADTMEMLQTVRDSFRRMQEVLQAVRTLSSGEATLGAICEATARTLRNRALPLADIELDLQPDSATSLRTGRVVAALVMLVSDVFDRSALAPSERRKRPRITLRTFVAEGAAIIEIEDDLDVPHASSARAGRRDPVAEVRARLNGDGGELQLASEPGRTTVRLVLPLAALPQTSTHEAPRPGTRASRAN